MVGPVVDSAAVVVGGLLGVSAGKFLPERVKDGLPMVFGVVTLGLGGAFLGRAAHLPVVVMAMILGTLVGELLYAEKGLHVVLQYSLRWAHKHTRADDDYIVRYVTLIAAMCFGSLGLMGALHEGMTGESEILFTKAVLDLFTAGVFAAAMGLPIVLIAVPQFLILTALYFSGAFLMPMVNADMLANFTATGGVIFLATGLRLCNIKVIAVVNMVPALILAFPLTALWARIVPLLAPAATSAAG